MAGEHAHLCHTQASAGKLQVPCPLNPSALLRLISTHLRMLQAGQMPIGQEKMHLCTVPGKSQH